MCSLIASVTIENFKSIVELTVPLGALTVLIGENGSGKSNVLEGIALGAAAASNKTDHEYFATRGIRSTAWDSMLCRLIPSSQTVMKTTFRMPDQPGAQFMVYPNPETGTLVSPRYDKISEIMSILREVIAEGQTNPTRAAELFQSFDELHVEGLPPGLPDFLIYSPENTALRTFQREGQILPLGVNGEGLFAHLKWLAEHEPTVIERLNEQLNLITWFDGFTLPTDLGVNEHRLDLRDRFVDGVIDQRSANEGFLFLLFYFTLLLSPRTPSFFAIDNVDASLNPKLCREFITRMAALAVETGKQVIVTTHNPAVLDGLNLHDEQQRLLVVSRGRHGETRVKTVKPPRPVPGSEQPPVPLSEAFMTGLLGGLPDGF